jgi:hypothetical protein
MTPEADPERFQRDRATGPDPHRAGARTEPPRIGTLRIWSVLGRALSIFGRNAPGFVVISAAVHLPLFAYLAYGKAVVVGDEADLASEFQILLSADGAAAWAHSLLAMIVSGPIAYGVVQHLRGRKASVGACVAAGVRSLPRVLGVSLVLGALLAASFVLFLAWLSAPTGTSAGDGHPLLSFILLIALILVSVVVQCRHAVAVTAAVVERANPVRALSRSRRLTQGSAWRVFGLWFILFLAEWAVAAVLDGLTGGATGPRRRFAFLVEVLASALLWTPLFSTALAVCYHDLRVNAEGVDADQLAQVFE